MLDLADISPAERPSLSAVPDGRGLRAESVRLRADFVRAQLEINMTIAGFSDCQGCSHRLLESSRRAAVNGCGLIREMVRTAGAGEREELEKKLRWLEAKLAQMEPGEAYHPPPSYEKDLEKGQVEAAPPVKHAGNGLAAGTRKLTRRELEVLKHVAEGNSTKRVAEMLGITFKTAACHRYRVMDKLGIHETANLVRYAIRLGLIQP